MDLIYSKTVLKALNFKLLLQKCPFSLQFSPQVGLPYLNSLVTQNFPRGQKNDQIYSFLLILHILIGTLGSEILMVALSLLTPSY